MKHRVPVAGRAVWPLMAASLILGALASRANADALVVSTYAGNGTAAYRGDGGDRRKAALLFPVALAWADRDHLLYLDAGRDDGGRIRRINVSTGIIETITGGGLLSADSVPARDAKLSSMPWGLAVDAAGNIFIGYENAGRVDRIDARTGLIAQFAGGGDSLEDDIPAKRLALSKPVCVRVDGAGDVYIADAGLHAVFRVNAHTERVRRIAGTSGRPGYLGDGGPATAALLNWPADVALDREGNLYVADRDNHVIRLVRATSGTISTFAGTAGSPGFAGDGHDKLTARFNYPQSVLLEHGALLITDRMNHRIRKIDLATGRIVTIAGSGRPAYAGENIPALKAGLFEPSFMLRDHAGGLLVAAVRSKRIYLLGDRVDLPVPWWRSGWAMTSVVAGFVLLTLGFVQLRTRALRVRTAVLETSVRVRAHELTEQRALIERQAAELGELIETKDRLMAGISHEFRTPLTVILGPIDRLLERATAETFRDLLVATKRSASRLLRLVDQLLGMMRLSHGYAGPIESVAAARIITRIAASFESRAAERSVTMTLGVLEDLTLQANADALEVIASHLIANAVKFTPAGGHVRVALHSANGMAEIVVADGACGMSEDRLAELVEPFGGAPGAEADGAGEGLELVLVKQLVTALGGSMEVESELGKGTVFRVRFALAPIETSQPPLAAEPMMHPTTRFEGAAACESSATEATVLVIEDNAEMRGYLRDVLSLHCRGLFAEDGEQGLALAQTELPDLVVCDVMLPGRDGFVICHALKSDDRTSHIPIILLTALEGQKYKLRGLEERADDYLTKPFEERELHQRIANLLEIRSLLQRRYARDLRFDQTPPAELSQSDQAFLGKLARVTEARHADPEFDLANIASAMAMSERHLQRKLKALIGLAPAEYLRSHRLKKAYEQLKAGARPSNVALAVGFGSQAYFSACFKAQFGHSPGETKEQGLMRD